MTELEEDQEQELDDVQLVEDDDDDEEYALEEVDDDLEFLRDTSENLNLYLAFKAYHEDRNFEDAITNFEAAIAYEKKHSKPAKRDENGDKIPNATLAKCRYWLAEAHNKIEEHKKAIRIFQSVAKEFDTHYLGTAAQRRVDVLKAEA